MKLSSARHKSIPNHERIFSHKSLVMYRPRYLLLLSVWGGGRGADAPKIGMKFFFHEYHKSRALNKEQCPIYWRVVLMMIRYSPM